MKTTYALCLATLISMPTFALSQDPDTEEQIKKANEAAKSLGIKEPDMQKLMDEAAKEDAEDSKATPAAAATVTPTAAPHIAVDIPPGAAKGSITFDNVTSELKFAAAFVDQKDDRKPVVLLISDQKLPTEKWTSEFDMMRDHTKWSGVVFFLNKDGTVYRTDVHTKGQQASVSGYFDVKINDPASADLTGMATSDSSATDKRLQVTFHATRK